MSVNRVRGSAALVVSQPLKPCPCAVSPPSLAALEQRRDAPQQRIQHVVRAAGTRPVGAVLEALEVLVHPVGAPRVVLGELRDRVPVAILRRDGDHRVVGRAAAERSRPRIPDAVDLIIGRPSRAPRTWSPAAAASRSCSGGRSSPTGTRDTRSRPRGRSAPRTSTGRGSLVAQGSPPASRSSTEWPARARLAASGPPPAPDPITM